MSRFRFGLWIACAAGVVLAAGKASAASCSDPDFQTEEKCNDETPSSLKCVWVPQTPGDWDLAHYICSEKTCETLTELSAEGEPEVECRKMGCTWHEDVYYCASPGKNPPCELYYADPLEHESCPSHCFWDKDTESCYETGQKVPCDKYYDLSTCSASATGCTWHPEIYKCWATGDQIPCVEYKWYGKEECPTHCRWVTTGQGSYDHEEGECMDIGEEISCEEYNNNDDSSTEGGSCPTDRCRYYEFPINMCYVKDKPLPCMYLPGEACAPETRCSWEEVQVDGSYGGGSCTECPTDNCVEHYHGPTDGGGDKPDDGKPCDQHAGDDAYDCPEPRCFLEWPESSSGEGGAGNCGGGGGDGGNNEPICRDPTCLDLAWESDLCQAKSGCTYDDESGVCFDPSSAGGFPCKEIYEQSVCQKYASKCDFKSGSDPEGGYCYPKGGHVPCDMVYESSDCDRNYCEWIESQWMCKDKGAEQSCSSFQQEGECPEQRGCQWQDGICWEAGKEAPCSAFCEAFACEATGKCQFDKSSYTCKPCSGNCPTVGACTSYTEEATCPVAKCEWIYDENGYEEAGGGSGSCEDKACANVYSAQECQAKTDGVFPCAWDSDQMQCFPRGYDVPCSKEYEETTCNKRADCTWNADNWVCLEQGQELPCFDFDEEACGTGDAARCVWSDTMYQCVIKDSIEPASPEALDGKGDGTGNEDDSKCTTSLYAQVRAKLEQAEEDCIIIGRRNRRQGGPTSDEKIQQQECLQYFLGQSPNPTTIKAACPCLWFFAKEVSPYSDHWMQLPC